MATPLIPEQLDQPVTGYHTSAVTLGEVLSAPTTLLVFLRHYG
jgi:hypothetical protein